MRPTRSDGEPSSNAKDATRTTPKGSVPDVGSRTWIIFEVPELRLLPEVRNRGPSPCQLIWAGLSRRL